MNPAVVSLKGYAHVNRELLTSVSCCIQLISINFLPIPLDRKQEWINYFCKL